MNGGVRVSDIRDIRGKSLAKRVRKKFSYKVFSKYKTKIRGLFKEVRVNNVYSL